MSLRERSAVRRFGQVALAILSMVSFVVPSHDALVSNAHCLDSYPGAAAVQQLHELRRSLSRIQQAAHVITTSQ